MSEYDTDQDGKSNVWRYFIKSEDGKVHALDVQKGDRILFSKYAGTEITLEGEEHMILREDDVLAILE